MKLLNKILGAFGLHHDKQQALQLPAQKQKKQQQAVVLPDNIVTSKTGVFKVSKTEDSQCWERVQNKKQAAVDELTQTELNLLQAKKLSKDLVRAANFKRLWCSGCSAAEAAAAAGFSTRTLEKYWSIFNKTKTQCK